MNRSSPDNTRILVEAAGLGDRHAQNELLQRHLPALRAFVRLKSGQELRARESCSDVVQSVCMGIFEHLADFEWRGDASFRNWLFACALNTIRSHERFHRCQKRDLRREVDQHSEESATKLAQCYATLHTPSRDLMLKEKIQEIERTFDLLPESHRNVILDARVIGMKIKDIAEKDCKSEAAVRQLLSRALARLATLLDES